MTTHPANVYPTGRARTIQIARANTKINAMGRDYLRIDYLPRAGDCYRIARRLVREERLARQFAIVQRKPIPNPEKRLRKAASWRDMGRAMRREEARQKDQTT